MVHPRVYEALGQPLVGHLDPYFLELLDGVQADLRTAFRTENNMTLPISGTGSAGMEACLGNLIEDGDDVVVGVAGVFGNRMCEVASRLGARVHRVDAEWGDIVEPDAMAEALSKVDQPKIVAFVHAETSTGVSQPVPELAELAHRAGALVVLDTVTSLAGSPIELDTWGIDATYSGTQKCLSCPPGLSPVSFSERAMRAIGDRSTKTKSWYVDVSLLASYFGGDRVYHHTAPISMIYALAEALALVLEEGLEARFARHRAGHLALLAGLEVLGVQPAAREGFRLPQLNSVSVPGGVDEAALRRAMLLQHGIEIGAGLGPLAGRVWRIGLMGESCRIEHITRCVGALAQELCVQGVVAKGADAVAVQAATDAWGAA
jgi:alanine-glyoxylate transaminase/serine-glyoxylate transaminase/serine-pyruvate transaminase